jgi:hypothetical protein
MEQEFASLLYSASNFLALPFESGFKSLNFVGFAKSNVTLPVGLICAYLLFCSVGSKVMASQKPFDLRIPLAIWNALLCTFSFVGMCRTVSTSRKLRLLDNDTFI